MDKVYKLIFNIIFYAVEASEFLAKLSKGIFYTNFEIPIQLNNKSANRLINPGKTSSKQRNPTDPASKHFD